MLSLSCPQAVLLTWRTFWYVVGFWTWFFCHGFVIYTHNTKGTEEQPGMVRWHGECGAGGYGYAHGGVWVPQG